MSVKAILKEFNVYRLKRVELLNDIRSKTRYLSVNNTIDGDSRMDHLLNYESKNGYFTKFGISPIEEKLDKYDVKKDIKDYLNLLLEIRNDINTILELEQKMAEF